MLLHSNIIKTLSLFLIISLYPILHSAQVYNYADSVIDFSSEYNDTGSWNADQILGHFDTYPCFGDISTSWAPSSTNHREFIELHFNNAAPIDSIYIYETDGSGAIDTVYLKNPNTDLWDIVYTATPVNINYSRILKIGFPITNYNVSEVRIALDNALVPGWNEIDAVAINSVPDELPDAQELGCGAVSISIGNTCSNYNIAEATYSWSTTTGNIVSGADQAHAIVSDVGLYTLTVTKNGDVVSYDVQVSQNSQIPTINSIMDITGCQSITLPSITGINLSGNEKYYTEPSGAGTSFQGGDVISANLFTSYPVTLYAFDIYGLPMDGCSDQKTFNIVINELPNVDLLNDDSVCDEYILPTLTVGNYYSQSNGMGISMNVGDVINSSQTIYIYDGIASCHNESSFDITVVDSPTVDELLNVTECDAYTLPQLSSGNYFTGISGTGLSLSEGAEITNSLTIYIYDNIGDCTGNSDFEVEINNTPIVNEPNNVSSLDSYVLPDLLVGNYFTETEGGGVMLSSGDMITSSQTIFIYATNGECWAESSFELTITTLPECVTILSPTINETNVSLSGGVSWETLDNTTGYKINIGTTEGGSEVVSSLDVGNDLGYTHTELWLQNTTYYVTVIPYNNQGDAIGCSVLTFTTELLIPECTAITFPSNGQLGVPLTNDIIWLPIEFADGYFITIGSSPMGNDIENNFDVGSDLVYTPTPSWQEFTTYYVTIIAYNETGSSENCVETNFTTELVTELANCVEITSPINGSIDISLADGILWTAVEGADGYIVSLGTSSGGTEVVDNLDVGSNLSYFPTEPWLETTTYYVTITPYNIAGSTIDCIETVFTSENELLMPTCPEITFPFDGTTEVALSESLFWMPVLDAEGYYLSIGTLPGHTDVVDGMDMGNNTSYLPSGLWSNATTYYVTINAYNELGTSTNCEEYVFTTKNTLPPSCTVVTSPYNEQKFVDLFEYIIWNPVPEAHGYLINIGTSPDGTDIEYNMDTGLANTYQVPIKWNGNTTYYVTITSYNENGNSIGCEQIKFTTKSESQIPQFFTPNGDGVNDYWQIENSDFNINQIMVYDRYGKALAKFTTSDIGWDGTSAGQQMPNTDYWYVIELRNGENLKGHFSLVRK